MTSQVGKSFILAGLVLLLSGPARSQSLVQVVGQTVQKYDTVVNGNQVPPEFQALFNQLGAREEAVRIEGVRAITLAGSPIGALLLRRSIDGSLERSAAVRSEAAKGLGEIGGRQALEVLGIGLADRDATVRIQTVHALRYAGTVFAIPYIQEAARNDRAADVRVEAVRMLRKIGTQFAAQPLNEVLLNDRDTGLRLAAADALGEIGKKESQVARMLGEARLAERDAAVRLEIVKSLGLVRDRAGLPFLAQAMGDRDLTVRLRATEIYGRVLGLQ